MYVYAFPRPASTFDFNRNRPASPNLISKNIALARRALLGVLIHEIAHAAGKNATFSHLEIDAAALAADPKLVQGMGKGELFNAFILKHCGVGFELQK